jgi:hypothetical protein
MASDTVSSAQKAAKLKQMLSSYYEVEENGEETTLNQLENEFR